MDIWFLAMNDLFQVPRSALSYEEEKNLNSDTEKTFKESNDRHILGRKVSFFADDLFRTEN